MRTLALIAVLFMLLGAVVPFARAEDDPRDQEIEALKQAMEKLRTEYQTEISQLRAQIKGLTDERAATVVRAVDEKMDEKIEEKLKSMEYVGRYEGPFEKGGLLLRNPSGFGNVSVGGYADIELENFSNTNSTFDQARWILNIGAELGERLRFYSEYEIEHGGPNAANSGQGEAKVEQAWMDYLITDAVNLRAGALLVPFGRYNLYHDSDLQDLTERPLLARRVIPTTWTESGAGFYGELSPAIGGYEDLTIGYEAYFINGFDADFSDTGLRGARGSLSSDNNNRKSLVSRVVLSPALGHEIGVSSYLSGKFNNLNDSITGLGIDGLTTWGPLEVIGEWAYFHIDEPATGTDLPEWAKGFYLQANYHFWPEFLNHTFLGRSFEDPKFTFVNRLGWVGIEDDTDTANALDHNYEWRYTMGLNYRPVESWVFKFEWQINSNNAENLERGSNDGFIASIAMGF